ncbi:hypothetical protein [Ktedonospora formicarum]|uniref:Uncharacterized protein n=1 Tax=Ktedonospora formicarum TaxID=2778364 RepID=A0A8J3MT57_9CHLR|nr:hypothetical protein [Ktedonospora formicarum]GHO45536.1 hypothetical protein KSX_36990 [Ktedonospora formicarum]
MPTIAHWCGCCALPIRGNPPNDECPRCHYPVEIRKEESFLERSLRDLHRATIYQRNILTVSELISTYQARMLLLQREQQAKVVAQALASMPEAPVKPATTSSTDIQVEQTTQKIPTVEPALSAHITFFPEPVASLTNPSTTQASKPVRSADETITSPTPTPKPKSTPVAPPPVQAPRQVFSLKSFFEDQTINIVASLGAFMILAGSLGFVATTDKPLVSFLIMLLVHAIFGVVGLIAQRFASFRVVSLIYTAIFALLIPLVGFSAYQLAAGSLVTISPPALIAMASAYAAIAYGSLAVYQRFSIFSYLALVALSIADLAAAYALHLSAPWMGCALMPLALLAMIILPKDKMSVSIFDGRLAILREPLAIAMYTWVVICVLSISYALMRALLSASISSGVSDLEPRFALCGQVALLLLWASGMAWRTSKGRWILGSYYLFATLALSIAFTLSLHAAGYALVLIGTALCYHLLIRFSPAFMSALQPQKLEMHLEAVTIFLTAVAPLVGMLNMPQLLIQRTFDAGNPFTLPADAIATLIVCTLGLLITLSALAHHMARSPRTTDSKFKITLFLLLGGYLLYWGCGALTLLLPVHPTWLFLGVTLLLTALAYMVRRDHGASLGLPLELVALAGIGLTLTFAISLPDTILLMLLFGFEGIYYILALSQCRPRLLWLMALFPYLTLGPLFHHQALLFCLSLGLPIGAALLRNRSRQAHEGMKLSFTWEWVFFMQALLYGLYNLTFIGLDILFPGEFNTLARELHISMPAVLKLALLAGVWYLVAVITRRTFWLSITTFFAIIAVCLPDNNFQFQSWLAPLSILITLGILMRFGRVWSLPFAITAILATFMVSVSGQAEHMQTAMTWVLLGCAALYYVAGVISHEPLATALAPATFLLLIKVSPNTFALLAWFAPLSIILTLGARLLLGRKYSLSLGLTSFIAICVLGILGGTSSNQGTLTTTFWLLLLCAALVYGASVIARERVFAWGASALIVWAFLLPVNMFAFIVWIAPLSILLALGVRLVAGRQAALPLALAAGIATLAVGITGATWNEMATAAWVLLLCAQLIYISGLVSRESSVTWLAPLFTTWSVYYAGLQGDLYRPALVALTFALLGIVSRYISFLKTEESAWWRSYRLPLYATALASALLTGIYGSLANVNVPFYTAVPDILVLYALIGYIVLLNEHQVTTLWQGLVLGFSIWGLALGTRVATCDMASHACSPLQIQQEGWYLLALTLGLGIVGLLVGRLARYIAPSVQDDERRGAILALRFNACWYLASLMGIIILTSWQQSISNYQYSGLTPLWLTSLLALSLIVMFVESLPEMLVLCASLAFWVIRDMPWADWQQALAYSGLMLLVFASPWLWQRRALVTRWFSPQSIAQVLSLGGQCLVVLWLAGRGGLVDQSSPLTHTSAFSLLLLAGLASLTGYTQHARQWHRWYYYIALLLASGAISWELLALQQTSFDVLTLPLATGVILVAAFLQRDEGLPAQRIGARLSAILGAALLLLPTLWLSFSGKNLTPTLLLGGEALILLIIGIGTRIRVFVLSGAALVIVAAMHALFLPTLGLPPSLALAIMGLTLLALATSLSLTRHRLRHAWTQWQ